MKHVLEVCLVALSVSVGIVACGAESPDVPVLRKGISVNLPVTSNAAALPAADDEDALVVAITRNGIVFLGTDLVSTARLSVRLRNDVSARTEKNVYVKADAGTPYRHVIEVIDAIHNAGLESVGFLTDQRNLPHTGTLRPPAGWDVAIRPAPGGGITVHVATAARGSATVKVNGEAVPQSNLEARLRQLLASGGQVNVSADAALPFGEVARVVDACHLPGTKVMLVAEM